MKSYRPYHTACDGLLGPDEPSAEAIRQKADETEEWRICRTCHDYIDGSANITIREIDKPSAAKTGPSREGPPIVILTAGLLFGDESKGTTVDWLTAEHRAHTVVRYCGGPQAAHSVVTPDGREHVFAQFGSGTFLGAETHLSRHMLVDPFRLVSEAKVLAAKDVPEPLSLVTIDRRAPLVTPLHKLACQAREQARGADRHGSCGMGIWETTDYARHFYEDAPIVGDLAISPARFFEKLLLLKLHLVEKLRASAATSTVYRELVDFDVQALHQRYRELDFQENTSLGKARVVERHYLADRMRRGTTIFEGSQGVLLDENYGFHPYTTGSTTTFANAEHILGQADFSGKVRKIGITRCYATRHGPGPLPTEMAESPVSEVHNKSHTWAGAFRAGPLDMVLLKHSLRILGHVDELAVSHLDQWEHFGQAAVGYESDAAGARYLCRYGAALRAGMPLDPRFGQALAKMRPVLREVEYPVALIEQQLGYPVTIDASGPSRSDRGARRRRNN